MLKKLFVSENEKNSNKIKTKEENPEFIIEERAFPNSMEFVMDIIPVSETRVFVIPETHSRLGNANANDNSFDSSFVYDFNEKQSTYYQLDPLDSNPIYMYSRVDWVHFDSKRDQLLMFLNSENRSDNYEYGKYR